MKKVCSFFGNGKINGNEELKQRVRATVVSLIEDHDVRVFLFKSEDAFDMFFFSIVTELKETSYPDIRRKVYTSYSDTLFCQEESDRWEERFFHFEKRKTTLLEGGEEVEYITKPATGLAQYVERSQAMIDNSDFCVFYYDPNKSPSGRKVSKSFVGKNDPKSKILLALEYAYQKKEQGKKIVVINLYKDEKGKFR